jgi:topoisomerase IA-like protein
VRTPAWLLEEGEMAKYGKKAQEKVEKVMHERKHGTLRSGSGKKVTSRKQAIAIGLSEARRAGGKVPTKRTSRKKTATRKTAARKTTTKRKTATKRTARKR